MKNQKIISRYCIKCEQISKQNPKPTKEGPHGYTLKYDCENCGDVEEYRAKNEKGISFEKSIEGPILIATKPSLTKDPKVHITYAQHAIKQVPTKVCKYKRKLTFLQHRKPQKKDLEWLTEILNTLRS